VKIHRKLMHIYASCGDTRISTFHSTGGTLFFSFIVNIVFIYS